MHIMKGCRASAAELTGGVSTYVVHGSILAPSAEELEWVVVRSGRPPDQGGNSRLWGFFLNQQLKPGVKQ